MAPFTPFIAEKIYQEMGGEKESVHLEMWPEVEKQYLNEKILQSMNLARKVVEMGLSARSDAKINVRQPLQSIYYQGEKLGDELEKVLADELNIKEVVASEEIKEGENQVLKEDGGIKIALNTLLTAELKKEGLVREIVRTINQLRKNMKLTIADRVVVEYETTSGDLQEVFQVNGEEIKKSVLATELHSGTVDEEPIEVGGQPVKIKLTVV
jgi:isoleucyl-tRNA synthetase